MAYGWIITKDHLHWEADSEYNEFGTAGPSDMPAHLEEVLAGTRTDIPRYEFKMYDDDKILYYTGFGTWDPEDEKDPQGDHETALVGPLRDFGAPNAGAVTIDWTGHPEWACEW